MAQPTPLQEQFGGMFRDASRDDLPPGKVWNLVDFIPGQLGAPLRKRGGWSYHGSALTTLDASAGVPARVAVAPFSGGTQVIAIDDRANPELFDLTNSADRGSVYGASGGTPLGPLKFYREQVLIPSHDLDSGPVNPRKYVAAGTISDLSGAPGSRYFEVHKDRVAAASADTDTPNRIYFSAAGNAESWDTTNRYIDTSSRPVALASIGNALLVFHAGSVERIRGDIPPGSAAANMTLEPLYDNIGVFESDSVAVAGDNVYFADESGVYTTNGSGPPLSLTRQGGIDRYWHDQIGTGASIGYMALEVWRDFLFCSVLNISGGYVDFLVCQLANRQWFRFDNIHAWDFATRHEIPDEIYFSNRDGIEYRVGKLSSVFDPDATVRNDADGAAVVPILETPFYALKGQGKKRWRHIYLSHDTRGGSSDNPIQTISYLASPEATSYTALSPTLSETTARSRRRLPIGASPSYGMAFKVAQTNASSDTRIYALEADVAMQEGSRR